MGQFCKNDLKSRTVEPDRDPAGQVTSAANEDKQVYLLIAEIIVLILAW
jgi:hypothetical protein